MYIHNGSIVTSASDLSAAAHCEFAVLRKLDALLGRIEAVAKPDDPMLERASVLGDEHEQRVLDSLVHTHGQRVTTVAKPDLRDDDSVARAVDDTMAALASGVDVVFQATFATDEFIGFADFLVRQADGRYMVQDSKLARTARVTALLQLAAYVAQLDRLGVPRSDTVQLLLGDGSVSTHRVDDIMPVFRRQWARLRSLVIERAAAGTPTAWGDPRFRACGRCEWCTPEVERERDLLLVAGMRPTQRGRLIEAGITTIEALAEASAPPSTMAIESFEGLRAQAQLQLLAVQKGDDVAPPYEVAQAEALAAIPAPDAGDLFFDFEGDPLYTEGAGRFWGLDYLFGWVDADGVFAALWAHSFAEERQALVDFVAFVRARRSRHPGLHIYHYAPYETSHLSAMAARYGVCEAEVDALLREGVFVDLYPIVRRAVRVGSRSYSIKALEPLYMGAESRTDMAVTKGDQSIEVYLSWRAAVADGRAAESAEILRGIADYNEYDCVSTLKLRDWMLGLARERGISPAVVPVELQVSFEESPTAHGLREWAQTLDEGAGDDDRADVAAEADALRLAAAALDYYPRERKSYWAEHFFRLEQPVESWAERGNVLLVDRDRSAVTQPWGTEGRQRKARRRLRLRGAMAPGFTLRQGERVFVLYDPPTPFGGQAAQPHMRGTQDAEIIEVLDDGVTINGLLIEESADGGNWDTLPMAVAPGWPIRTEGQETAIADWAARLLTDRELRRDPATDVLLRRASRAGSNEPVAGDNIGAVVGALEHLDRGFVAVQGPPGTGKTYVGSRVIARLVREHGWRIGVVAQSHRVVENVLDGVVAAGVAPELVAKALSGSQPEDHAFTALPSKPAAARFASEHATTGFVLGGTAWDFANPRNIPRGSLDLLVIDEAGQFSLANTIAVSLVAPRLLLLGDPQQLPQVSQGTHPEPVDTSALGWVIGDHAVLPDEFGFFLSESWRMHPAIAAPVSHLSYEGKLLSHPSAVVRHLDGIEPGLHAIAVEHSGNATSSTEEADEVVRIAREVLGRAWTEVRVDGNGVAIAEPARPLEQSDIIVVTPYNAQLQCVRAALDAAGLHDVPVGTVDKFQGQEAAVAIMSLAASSAAEVPRGIEFLLMRNRLNVAISRAKLAAYLLYSPALLDDLPRTPLGVAQLSAFARLVGDDDGRGGA
ncbi:MAG TPA: TM0106 family RecB-like putative nuclease [Microbacteriaceae bacterium]|nr:TM0106 family RecB-like putative nuclease [Microbacteriaceae bacterium]HQX34866.1 TM0106 family RecB-like putative nuclease [Microbacteriaceae bacterium]HQZ47989.1 TM0106 family RecB-like putative nuclease [Microbacteriaceae bacterium]HRA08184.1 TM0106 family RecB-like putative nuclease [Microbacteriaceae bacterium]